MFPCCGYDPGLAAYLSALDADEQREIIEHNAVDTRLFAGCLAVVGVIYAILLMVV